MHKYRQAIIERILGEFVASIVQLQMIDFIELQRQVRQQASCFGGFWLVFHGSGRNDAACRLAGLSIGVSLSYRWPVDTHGDRPTALQSNASFALMCFAGGHRVTSDRWMTTDQWPPSHRAGRSRHPRSRASALKMKRQRIAGLEI